MRKKYILNQISDLRNNIEKAETEIELLKMEVAKRDKTIEKLKQECKANDFDSDSTKPLKNLEAKVIQQAKVDRDVEYAASVIGKIVIEAAKCCNALTGTAQTPNAKELVNLVLGRTEVAKSEILKIVSSDYDHDEKKSAVDKQYELAVDYFNSILGQ